MPRVVLCMIVTGFYFIFLYLVASKILRALRLAWLEGLSVQSYFWHYCHSRVGLKILNHGESEVLFSNFKSSKSLSSSITLSVSIFHQLIIFVYIIKLVSKNPRGSHLLVEGHWPRWSIGRVVVGRVPGNLCLGDWPQAGSGSRRGRCSGRSQYYQSNRSL